jgi:hypothetical protein
MAKVIALSLTLEKEIQKNYHPIKSIFTPNVTLDNKIKCLLLFYLWQPHQ